MSPVISNVSTYLDIAEEASAEMIRLLNSQRRSKPDGSPGYITLYDAGQSSFKQALICVTFSAIYFEALVYLVANERHGESGARMIDKKPYEERLKSLGVIDPMLLGAAKRLREIRKELVHEKAFPICDIGQKRMFAAQGAANESIEFVREVTRAISDLSRPID